MKVNAVISAIFLLQAAAALAVYVPHQAGDQDPEFYIHSPHIPSYIAPMNLTTGELKLFAGHSMQFLKAKCPGVPKEQLNQISKYIAKLVSKTNPVPERSPKFDNLLNSISTCATKERGATEEPKEEESSYFSSFYTPFIKIKGFFSSWDGDSKDEGKKEGVTETSEQPKVLTPADPTTESSDKRTESLAKKDDSDEQQDSIAASPKPKLPSTKENPFIQIVSFSDDDGSWNPIGWIKNAFHAIRNYFEKIFWPSTSSTDSDVVAPKDSTRPKRDVSTQEVEVFDAEAPKKEPKEEQPDEKKIMDKFVASVEKPENKGKLAFLHLMDDLCRVYCSECRDVNQIMNFKAATKALLNFLYEDTTGVELAAKHYLDPAVIEALDKC